MAQRKTPQGAPSSRSANPVVDPFEEDTHEVVEPSHRSFQNGDIERLFEDASPRDSFVESGTLDESGLSWNIDMPARQNEDATENDDEPTVVTNVSEEKARELKEACAHKSSQRLQYLKQGVSSGNSAAPMESKVVDQHPTMPSPPLDPPEATNAPLSHSEAGGVTPSHENAVWEAPTEGGASPQPNHKAVGNPAIQMPPEAMIATPAAVAGTQGIPEATPASSAAPTTGSRENPNHLEAPTAVEQPVLEAPRPTTKKGVGLVTVMLIVTVASLLSMLLGTGLTLAMLTRPWVQQQIFAAQNGVSSGVSEAPPELEDGPIGQQFAPTKSSDAGQGPGEPRDPPPIAVPTLDASSETMAPLDGSEVDEEDAAEERALDEEPAKGQVLPIGYSRRRVRITYINRAKLRNLAKTIRENRGTKYEVIGYVTPGETNDPDLGRGIGVRRARKAINILRSLGLSSRRFKAQAGNPAEVPDVPQKRGRKRSYGAVVMSELASEGE